MDLVLKLAVKALLPRNHGGLESTTVVIVDGNIRGKSTHLNFYNFVDHAIQYGINVNSDLERIVGKKSFTVYQLGDTIICNLTKIIQKFNSNLIIITGLFAIYDQLYFSERKWLLKHIVKSICSVSETIIVAFFSSVFIDRFKKIIKNNTKTKQ